MPYASFELISASKTLCTGACFRRVANRARAPGAIRAEQIVTFLLNGLK
jgi:hypothetical protein